MTARIRYVDAEPNGLAAMLGGVIEGNVAAHPAAEALLSRSGFTTYSISTSDIDVGVSIRVGQGSVTIRNGAVSRPQIAIRGTSSTLIALSSVPLRFGLPDVMTPEGRAVIKEVLSRKLTLKGMVRHPLALARLTRLLAVGRADPRKGE
jgi:outer membrane receptor protein involved in Fe transport